MIIGNGMIAKSFESYRDNNEILIFASGVSNSKNIDDSSFNREVLLLTDVINNNPEKVIVYFSTCSMYDQSTRKSRYVKHKKNMEKVVKSKCDQFYIFRLPQVVGITKSPTLVNFLFASFLNNKKVDINKNSTRNLIDVEDVFLIADYLIANKIYTNEVTNIATPNNILVIEIVKIIEEITGLSLNYNLIDCGNSFDINIDKIRNLNTEFNIFGSRYLHNILCYYFSKLNSLS